MIGFDANRKENRGQVIAYSTSAAVMRSKAGVDAFTANFSAQELQRGENEKYATEDFAFVPKGSAKFTSKKDLFRETRDEEISGLMHLTEEIRRFVADAMAARNVGPDSLVIVHGGYRNHIQWIVSGPDGALKVDASYWIGVPAPAMRFAEAVGTGIRKAAPQAIMLLEVFACTDESVLQETCDGFDAVGLPAVVVGMIGDSRGSELLQRVDESHRLKVVGRLEYVPEFLQFLRGGLHCAMGFPADRILTRAQMKQPRESVKVIMQEVEGQFDIRNKAILKKVEERGQQLAKVDRKLLTAERIRVLELLLKRNAKAKRFYEQANRLGYRHNKLAREMHLDEMPYSFFCQGFDFRNVEDFRNHLDDERGGDTAVFDQRELDVEPKKWPEPELAGEAGVKWREMAIAGFAAMTAKGTLDIVDAVALQIEGDSHPLPREQADLASYVAMHKAAQNAWGVPDGLSEEDSAVFFGLWHHMRAFGLQRDEMVAAIVESVAK